MDVGRGKTGRARSGCHAIMTAKTPIAAEVQRLLADGADSQVIVRVIEAAELHALTVRAQNGNRGSRLDSDWHPSHDDIGYALKRGMSLDRIEVEVERFRNYWTSKTGKGATKRDWGATWRNWIISTVERTNAAARTNPRCQAGTYTAARSAPTGPDAVLAAMGRIAHRIDEKRVPLGPIDQERASNSDTPLQLDLKPGGTGGSDKPYQRT
jgi:hypothetical protein